MEHAGGKQRAQRATIDDVAAMAGVSKTTVSRYLSGNYDVIADKTRKRIEAVIEELDYRPNQLARGLKANRSYLIGMVVADITNPFSVAVLRGAEDVCKRHGYSLMVCNTDNDPKKERDYIFTLQSHRIDGLIINTTGQNNDFLHQLAADNTLVVLVDRKVPELGFDTVGVNNVDAAADGARYLVDQGYQRIAFVTEPPAGISSRTERLEAFRDVLRTAGHPSSDRDVFEVGRGSTGELEACLRAFLEETQGMSRAVFAANGVMTLQVLLALKELGAEVPRDIALAGFDNLDWMAVAGSGITAIAQPTYEIGVAAMERILTRIEGDKSPAQIMQLPGELIVRGSTPKLANVE